MVKLNMKERIELTNILPQQGDILTLRTGMEITGMMYPSNEEQVEFSVKNENGMMSWNDKGETEKEFSFSPLQIGLLKKQLKELDETKALKPLHISIYEKIMEGIA